MNVNDIVKAYASGEIEREHLREIFEGIGFSSQVTDCLLARADGKKRIYEDDEANGIDATKFQVSSNDCLSQNHSPSGPFDEE